MNLFFFMNKLLMCSFTKSNTPDIGDVIYDVVNKKIQKNIDNALYGRIKIKDNDVLSCPYLKELLSIVYLKKLIGDTHWTEDASEFLDSIIEYYGNIIEDKFIEVVDEEIQIIINDLQKEINKKIEEDPGLYMKYKKFYDRLGVDMSFVPSYLRRSEKSGLLDLKQESLQNFTNWYKEKFNKYVKLKNVQKLTDDEIVELLKDENSKLIREEVINLFYEFLNRKIEDENISKIIENKGTFVLYLAMLKLIIDDKIDIIEWAFNNLKVFTEFSGHSVVHMIHTFTTAPKYLKELKDKMVLNKTQDGGVIMRGNNSYVFETDLLKYYYLPDNFVDFLAEYMPKILKDIVENITPEKQEEYNYLIRGDKSGLWGLKQESLTGWLIKKFNKNIKKLSEQEIHDLFKEKISGETIMWLYYEILKRRIEYENMKNILIIHGVSELYSAAIYLILENDMSTIKYLLDKYSNRVSLDDLIDHIKDISNRNKEAKKYFKDRLKVNTKLTNKVEDDEILKRSRSVGLFGHEEEPIVYYLPDNFVDFIADNYPEKIKEIYEDITPEKQEEYRHLIRGNKTGLWELKQEK